MKNFVDLFSLTLHRAVAKKMLLNEAEVLRIARDNLDRWLKKPGFAGREGRPLRECKTILDSTPPEEIRRIITSDTDEGQRLRSSSPFAGVLTEAERNKIWGECAEVGLA